MKPTSDYRPDIDGLRAVAVLAVVFYHAGATPMPGGFVGVDVFFVISGFLITSILLKQSDAGTLSIRSFYERRIRRIVPALFAMLTAVLIFGILRMTPWDLKELATSAKYMVCSAANVFFYRVTAGYFSESTDGMPLLHTWSLGVEEQFYLFFPLMLMAAMRLKWGKRRIIWMIGALCAGSFGFCLWKMRSNTSACFYLLPWRAWELMMGALLAAGTPALARWASARPAMRPIPLAIAFLGAGLIVAPIVGYGTTTPFPGLAALAPCLGACLIIAAGTIGNNAVSRALSARPMVFIGLISYSVYLWHWPMLAFQHYLNLTAPDTLSATERLLMGAASFPIGYLSWRFIEQPFRTDRWKGGVLFSGFIALCVLMLSASFFIEKNKGFENRMPDRARKFLAYKQGPLSDPVFVPNLPPSEDAVYGDANKKPHIVLWGDSHGEALREGLGELARDHGVSFRFYGRGGNGPFVGMRRLRPAWPGGNSAEKDKEYNDQALARIEANPAITKVVLIARWSGYTEGDPGEGGSPMDRVRIGRQDGTPFTSVAEARGALAGCIRNTVERLRKAGKTVFLIYPVPEVPFDVPSTVAREILIGHDPDARRVPAQGIFHERQTFAIGMLDAIPDGPDLVRLKPHEWLVKNGLVQFMEGDKAFYTDTNHLSLDGVRKLRPMLEAIFADPPPPKTIPLVHSSSNE